MTALRLAIMLAVLHGAARADVERFAVIVGHNDGAVDEQRLRFAEADARRVAELLGNVGGVPDEKGYYVVSELAVQTHFFELDQDGSRSLTGRFAARLALAIGAWR